ncbi:DUF3379 domain-containing protein [Motilimonas sp. 1_MG-2023]|uniref:DUF3379 domain-containing protein n=1 Tax=Motilimonas TaxID=1914248 RepID=UPI0026E3DC31|nr:DUF3379 domain-containing protein [Motilimonas sp. 1_MG-2023]MDO6524666.1 DUF3379 domain-containing protein [Motilimonas sp. 1_MG-2023]
MDDLEFRRRAYSNPNDQDEAFLSAAFEDEQNKKFLDEIKHFDEQIEASLKDIPVPEGLADRILLNQSFEQFQEKQRTSRWHLALAASIAFLIGMSVNLVQFPTSPNMGEIAIKHVQDEWIFTEQINENADLNAVNAKLIKYGGTVKEDIGHIYYVNHCSFNGAPAFHMIMAGEKGKVTLFVVPKSKSLTIDPMYSKGDMRALVMPVQNANLIIVADKNEPVGKLEQKLESTINWSI